MIVTEKTAKSILSISQVYPYVINPYTGCQHACSYCYARFMKRYSGHPEPWGEFVDVKINAPELLQREILRKRPGRVWVSGVCDAYQPLEAQYRLTRQCLEILLEHHWPVTIQTRSPLVLRDMDLLVRGAELEVGMSITTADDAVRRIFEPLAPAIEARINALGILHDAGIRTFVMIAPMLPGAEDLAKLLAGRVDHVILDRMNYHYADWVYRKYGLEDKRSPEYFARVEGNLADQFSKLGVSLS
ncbi:MAG: radical SAM protein [Anaerolineaceae bacterium]|jgi:DNA repair photolyase